ncbi:MAG: DUF447 domain-containing protein [Planctomycetota bacterium]
MIIEGLVTSVSSEGKINIAPMGPVVSRDFGALLLRPFQPSTTFSNLSATRCGVFHVVDQVDVIARAAIGRLDCLPAMHPATSVSGYVLDECCRWFEFKVDSIDASDARSRMPATVVHRGECRPFSGFNRARHAVLEAAILATRLHLIDRSDIEQTMAFLKSAVDKTGGTAEKGAFEMLRSHMNDFWTAVHRSASDAMTGNRESSDRGVA